MVKIRLISDIHYTTGINSNQKSYKHTPFGNYFSKEIEKEPECVTLIAGDIKEGTLQNVYFEDAFPSKNVYFVEGNHVVYDLNENILPQIRKKLKEKYPKDSGFYHYLENDWAFIPGTNESVAVIGSTFYTDYEYCNFTVDEYNSAQETWDAWSILYGLPIKESTKVNKLTKSLIRKENMFRSGMYLNDFKFGYRSKTDRLIPSDYLAYHKKAKKEVLRCYNEILKINKDCKIILMTHHCLSTKCIDEEYTKSKLNASYTSDLEDWIDTMPNIRLVHSGHVHCRKDFRFGKNNTRYVVNACGYIPYKEPFKEPKFNVNFIIDTDEL